ncbi:MAG: RNA polymerase sigma factor [Bdellovibrionales bacterium]|nr:RNA polymerase sigma factor [Bdellovibrionales bacterium]
MKEVSIQFTSTEGDVYELTCEQAIERYYSALYSYCFRMLDSQEDAEEVAQEVFLRAYGRPRKPVLGPSRPWFYTIARNMCIDRFRWWSRWRALFSASDDTPEITPLTPDEPMTMLAPLISSLPRSQKQVFLLRHLHDFSTAETAKILKMSEGAVKSTLSRAVHRLRKTIEENERK